MTRRLLDTNILSDLIRHPQGRVAAAIGALGEREICTSVIVAAELRFGAAKKGSIRLTTRMDSILSLIEIIPFATPADAVYGDLRARLERAGEVIGANDLLIAVQALSFGLVLVTDNEREFRRIPGLTVENWLR